MNQTVVRWLKRAIIVFSLVLTFTSPFLLAQNATTGDKETMNFQLSTTSFPSEGVIPKKFTCDAQDVSPELSWTGAPQTTKSFALIADDPDAPVGTWTHWLIWDIPASSHQLQEGMPKHAELPDGSRQGQNDFKKIGYNGPCPPPGKPHRYYFRLFALDGTLKIKAGALRKDLEAAMKGHVVAETHIMGRYGR